MRCPRCNHENRATARFCEECASPLTRNCGNCGSPLPEKAKFCRGLVPGIDAALASISQGSASQQPR